MRLKSFIAIAGIAALPALAMPSPATAQQAATAPIVQPSQPAVPPPRAARRRITITPRPLLYRRCTDWYELQNRPSGTVLYPQMRCWWVRG
jgi:hypothetical protein